MFASLLERLGLGGRKKPSVSTIRLEIIAEQVKEFNKAKEEMNHKLDTLENRTNSLDQTLSKTLDMTRDNQHRLEYIEGNIEKVIAISEALLKTKAETKTKEPETGTDAQKT